METGDYDETIKTLSTAIAKGEANANCYSFLGDVYQERNQYNDALYWCKMGIDHNGLHSFNYEGVGWINVNQGYFEKGVPWFTRALSVTSPETFLGMIGALLWWIVSDMNSFP